MLTIIGSFYKESTNQNKEEGFFGMLAQDDDHKIFVTIYNTENKMFRITPKQALGIMANKNFTAMVWPQTTKDFQVALKKLGKKAPWTVNKIIKKFETKTDSDST